MAQKKSTFLQTYKNQILSTYEKLPFSKFQTASLANIQKSMQIHKPFAQKNIFFCFLPNYFGKMASPQPVKCSIFFFYLFDPAYVHCPALVISEINLPNVP